MYWPIPEKVSSTCINALYPTLGPAKVWASPVSSHSPYPQISTSSPNPARKTKVSC
ncbi:hypothetical protein PISMIDRAFT_680930, partial [Pisolithus microcarpus 441]